MAVEFDHLFTGANSSLIQSLTPAIGTAMTAAAGGGTIQVTNNRVHAVAGSFAFPNSATQEAFTSADYTVRAATRFVAAVSATNKLEVHGRRTSDSNFVAIVVKDGSALLQQTVSGSQTTLDTTGYAPSPGTDSVWELAVSGNSASVLLDGVEVMSSAISAALATTGQAGLLWYAESGTRDGTTNHHVDRLTVTVADAADPSLIVETEPTTTASGYPIDPPIVVRATTDGSTTDTAFTGDVTAALVGAGGVLYGTTTVAAVAGVATFSNLVPCVEGTYVLEFTASSYTLAESANFSVTSGDGAGTPFTNDTMSRPIKDGETIAAKKRIPLILRDSAGAPTAASMTTRKAQLSANGGSETPSTNDIVQIAGTIRGYVELTNTEAASFAAGDYVEARVDGDTGLVEFVGYAEIFPDDVYAAALTEDTIADEVQTRTIAAVTSVGTVGALAPNSVNASALAADFVTEVQAGLATSAALATVSGKVDAVDDLLDAEMPALTTAVAAVKAKTDNLPASPAAVGSAMVLSSGGLLEVVNAVVRAANGADGYAVEKDVPNNRIVLTIPGVGTVNIPASFSESSPAVVALGD